MFFPTFAVKPFVQMYSKSTTFLWVGAYLSPVNPFNTVFWMYMTHVVCWNSEDLLLMYMSAMM